MLFCYLFQVIVRPTIVVKTIARGIGVNVAASAAFQIIIFLIANQYVSPAAVKVAVSTFAENIKDRLIVTKDKLLGLFILDASNNLAIASQFLSKNSR
jgi:hypothetical protein